MSAAARRLMLVAMATLVVLVLLAMVSVATGVVPLTMAQVVDALRGEGEASVVSIIRELRAPRMVLAALVGAGLATSGAALQGTMRNPLAEPYLLGVSGGAAVGAVIAMAVGIASTATVTLAAFAGAACAIIVVLMVARVVGGSADGRVLLMAGVVVGAFANAAIMVALADAPPDRVRGALWWMMGSVAFATWSSVLWLSVALLVLGGLLLVYSRELDLLALGEEPATALGIDVDRATRRTFLVASWLAAATVSAAGLIGFVGLIVPNLARALGARRHRSMLTLSALQGAALMVAADLLARTLRAPAELPLGAVTALVGVPFFLTRVRGLR